MYINWLLSGLVFAGYLGAAQLIANILRDIGQRKKADGKEEQEAA